MAARKSWDRELFIIDIRFWICHAPPFLPPFLPSYYEFDNFITNIVCISQQADCAVSPASNVSVLCPMLILAFLYSAKDPSKLHLFSLAVSNSLNKAYKRKEPHAASSDWPTATTIANSSFILTRCLAICHKIPAHQMLHKAQAWAPTNPLHVALALIAVLHLVFQVPPYVSPLRTPDLEGNVVVYHCNNFRSPELYKTGESHSITWVKLRWKTAKIWGWRSAPGITQQNGPALALSQLQYEIFLARIPDQVITNDLRNLAI